jgi:hypothetical protein
MNTEEEKKIIELLKEIEAIKRKLLEMIGKK